MPVCGERQTPNNERETETNLNCFSPDWIWYLRREVEKGMATVAVVVDLWRNSCQPKKEEKTTNFTGLNNCR